MSLRHADIPGAAIGRHAWTPVLGLGVALFFADEQTMVSTNNPHFLPSVILLGSVAIPLAFLAFIYGRRLPYDVPTGVVWTVGVLSGVIGTIVAGVLEFRTVQRLGFIPMLGVGLIEEAAKLVFPLAILLFWRYRRPADGLLIGVASGAGFAALETMGYGLVALVQSHGDVSSVQNLLMVRGLMSPAGHMAWTGISAAALWAAAAQGWSARGLGRFLVSFLVVVALHTAWDSAHSITAYVVIGVISLAVLASVAHRLAHSASRVPAYPTGDPAPRTADAVDFGPSGLTVPPVPPREPWRRL